MTSDEEKRRKEIERKSSPSSPDALRGKDEIEKLKREIAISQNREEKAVLQRRILQQQIVDDTAKSAPAKEHRQNIASASEKVATTDAKEFAETAEKRGKARQEAMDQGLEQETEERG